MAAPGPADPVAAIAAALAPVMQQMGGLAQQLTAALNAIQQQAAAVAAPAVNFHRTPMAAITGIVDYESKEGKKHYEHMRRRTSTPKPDRHKIPRCSTISS
jgi:hypothetical protein